MWDICCNPITLAFTVMTRWVGCTLTIMTWCLPGEWAARWQSWPSTCQASGLHPDNRDPVLSEYTHMNAESDSNHCAFRQSAQYLLVVKLQACEDKGRAMSLVWNPAVVVSLLQLASSLWLVSTRWQCGPKPSTETTLRSSRTTPVAEPPSFLSSCEATKGHYSGPWRELRPLLWHSVLTFCWWLLLTWENVAVRGFKICSVFHICLCSERISQSVGGFLCA